MNWNPIACARKVRFETYEDAEAEAKFIRENQHLVRLAVVIGGYFAAWGSVTVAVGVAMRSLSMTIAASIGPLKAFTAWMMLKLVVVGLLVVIHIRSGYLILNLFGAHGHYAAWRRWIMTTATLATITGILTLVLAKPELSPNGLPTWLTQPGGLQSLVETIRPTP